MTVRHRLMVSGSDRFCDKWRRDHLISGAGEWDMHHLYRAMGFLGKALPDHEQDTAIGLRRNKDKIEERLFFNNRGLFSKLDLVFSDTTSIYFEGQSGEYFGRRGFSKDHCPDLRQMVVGAVLDDNGRSICFGM